MTTRANAAGCRRQSGHDGGFTLLELLIVMVILGVLAAIAVFAVGGLDQASAVTACRADYKTVETALGAYETRNSGSTVTSVEQLVGGWLKEAPATSNGYLIGIDSHTQNVTVQSTNPAHAAADGNANCAYA